MCARAVLRKTVAPKAVVRRTSALLAAALVLSCLPGRGDVPVAQVARPKLVVLLAIDQLRADRLTPALQGGLGRLQREGRVFRDAAFTHAFTETCPGHAVMLSGRQPAKIGIPGNGFIDPETLEEHYCVEDRAPDAALLGVPAGSPADGRSPRNMLVDTLGDWMKAQRPGTRVFSVSGKDRAAIATAGRHPDAAYWLARGASPRFVTSRYYRASLPDWVQGWRADKVFAGLPDEWTYLAASVEAMDPGPRPDDYRSESPLLSRTQPHPLRRDPPGAEGLPSAARFAAERLYVTPYADLVTLAFAKDLVVNENLGRGPETDLLVVALSATDLVGHFYGPESWEAHDALVRLDRGIGKLLDFLEARVGAGRLVVVVTADHGVLPLPEWLYERGRSACPVQGGRIDPRPLLDGLEANLDARFGGAGSAAPGPWFAVESSRLTLNRPRVAAAGASEADVLAAARRYLEAKPGVVRVWSRDEVLAGRGPEPMATLYRNSWNPERAGDLAVQAGEDCLMSDRDTGTSHGSPYLYDRAVPLVFYGPGITPGDVRAAAGPVDIAPTLARLLGIKAPSGLDGSPLPLR